MNNRYILIIDSDDRTERTAKEVLNNMTDDKILSVSSINKAKELIENESILFLIIDLSFGNYDAIDFVNKIRRNCESINRQIPILAILEDNYNSDFKNEAIQSGIVDFIPKPFNSSQLESSILSMIKTQRIFIDSENYVGPDRRVDAMPTKIDKRGNRN